MKRKSKPAFERPVIEEVSIVRYRHGSAPDESVFDTYAEAARSAAESSLSAMFEPESAYGEISIGSAVDLIVQRRDDIVAILRWIDEDPRCAAAPIAGGTVLMRSSVDPNTYVVSACTFDGGRKITTFSGTAALERAISYARNYSAHGRVEDPDGLLGGKAVE